VKEGYLKEIPLHDAAEPTSWNVYYAKRQVGVACRVHGILTKKGFEADADAGAGGGHQRAFARERAAEESTFPPIDRIPVGGPITADALGLDPSVGEVTLGELRERAKAESARTRKVVALALRRMRHKDGVPVLKSLLADPDEYVRKQAAWALGNIGTPDDAGALAKLLEDPAERVRDFAAIALADGAVNLNAARSAFAASRWKNTKLEQGRVLELAKRVQSALEAVRAGQADEDLRKACERGIERLKPIGA
jgi:hypothetical protein